MSRLKVSQSVVCCLLAVAGVMQPQPASARNINYRNYVMGPLEPVHDWESFRLILRALKRNGVDAITTDVWWGLVEQQAGHFDWSYYLHYVQVLKEEGLNWVPILSFHKAGGNVGDTVTIHLPQWVWKIAGTMKYVGLNYHETDDSKRMVSNDEYISIWTQEAYPLYERLMASFAETFKPYASMMEKVYIGMGPAGELRYPSYVHAAGWRYPSIGLLQAYSPSAIGDWRSYLQDKYGTIHELNVAWHTHLSSFEDPHLQPPTDGLHFFRGGVNTTYKVDFMDWYQRSLEKHMSRMLKLGHAKMTESMGVRLGVKLAGIHWRAGDPEFPHAAEHAAGYYNYDRLLRVIAQNKADLTFTCLEMRDDNRFPNYSLPQQLVATIASLRKKYHIRIGGENALALHDDRAGYDRTRRALDENDFDAFTLLRSNDLVNADGTERHTMSIYHHYIASPVPPKSHPEWAPGHAEGGKFFDKIRHFVCEKLITGESPQEPPQWPPELSDLSSSN